MGGLARPGSDFGFDPSSFLFQVRNWSLRIAFRNQWISILAFNDPSQNAKECGGTDKIIHNIHVVYVTEDCFEVYGVKTTLSCCGRSAPIGAWGDPKTASPSRNCLKTTSGLENWALDQGGSCYTQEDRSWLTTRLKHRLASALGYTFWQVGLFLSCFTQSLQEAGQTPSIRHRLRPRQKAVRNLRQLSTNKLTTHETPRNGGRDFASAVFRAATA